MLGNQPEAAAHGNTEKIRVNTSHAAKRKKYNQTTHGG
jgi:hypothetical protein